MASSAKASLLRGTQARQSGGGSGSGGARVLLTGGCGFIGSNLAHYLTDVCREGLPVEMLVVLDSMTHGSDEANVASLLHEAASCPALAPSTQCACAADGASGCSACSSDGEIRESTIEGARCRSAGRVAVVQGEFGNGPLVARLLADYEIDHVLHLAGETHVDRSYTDPTRCIQVNVVQLVALLEASVGRILPLKRPIARFLHMSTDEVYGDTSKEPCRETASPMDPTNPYAASKGASELLVGAYRHSYGLPVVVVRCNNVYGPRQTTDKAVPRFVERALAGEAIHIHGTGQQTRNWVHAHDACRAIWTVAMEGQLGSAYNIGSDDEVSVIDVATIVRDIVVRDRDPVGGGVLVPIVHVPDRPHNDAHYHIDSQRIRDELGWRPRVPFAKGIADTVRWHMARALGSLGTPSGPTEGETCPPPAQEDRAGGGGDGDDDDGNGVAGDVHGCGRVPSPRVLVYGHRGWIGQQVIQLLDQHPSAPAVAFGQTRPGQDDDRTVEAEIDAVKPTHIVSLLGRTHGPGCGTVDYLEGPNPERLHENVRDNLYAPIMLSDAAVERGIHMTYLGTGCIYTYEDGKDGGEDPETGEPLPHRHSLHPDAAGFGENDAPNFRGSAYSTVKAFTDRLVRRMAARRAALSPQSEGDDSRQLAHGRCRPKPLPEGGPVRATVAGEPAVLNVRIRMPISGQNNARDFITKIVSYERVMDVPNSVTVLPELLPAMLDLMFEHRATGTINMVNPGAISHNQVLAMYREVVDPTFVIRNFERGPALDALMRKRSNCKLDTSALVAACPRHARPASVAVRACIEAMANPSS